MPIADQVRQIGLAFDVPALIAFLIKMKYSQTWHRLLNPQNENFLPHH